MKSLWTQKQTAEHLDISERTLEQWRWQGKGPAFLKIGRAVRYDPDTVKAWTQSRERFNTAGGRDSAMNDIETITVERSGRRPLRFQGERIASSNTSGIDDTRWTEAVVYRRPMYPNHTWTEKSETRGYVLAVSHMTRWDGETDQHEAHVIDSLGELAGVIEQELPTAVADELFEQLGIVEDLDGGTTP